MSVQRRLGDDRVDFLLMFFGWSPEKIRPGVNIVIFEASDGGEDSPSMCRQFPMGQHSFPLCWLGAVDELDGGTLRTLSNETSVVSNARRRGYDEVT